MISPENFLAEEQQKRTEYTETLSQTPGFGKLSERQQKIVLQSLYIQQRAERGSDPASADAMESPKTHVTEETKIHSEDYLLEQMIYNRRMTPQFRKYRTSQNLVANWYCHAAIYNLELERGYTEIPVRLPRRFFDATYHTADDYAELKNIAATVTYPSILHTGPNPKPVSPEKFAGHSCFVLGPNDNGDILVWEKKGYGLPYQLSTLEAVYKKYTKDFTGYHWGFRKLRSKDYYE